MSQFIQSRLFIRFMIVFVLGLLPILTTAKTSSLDNNFLVITDIHLDQSAYHTMEISPSSPSFLNDLDRPTFEKLLSLLDVNLKTGVVTPPKFLIILGDIQGHLRLTANGVAESESTVFSSLKNQFPNTPIFYAPGNNDSLKANYGPFTDPDAVGTLRSPADIAMSNAGWKNGFLSTGQSCVSAGKDITYPCLLNVESVAGYYSAYLEPKFRMIVLNSVMFAPKRNGISSDDAMAQLQWLDAQLQDARRNNESVMLAMHIPPGNNIYDHSAFWLSEEQKVFLDMIARYRGMIIGILASHTHAEELKLIQDDDNNNITGIFYTAGLSTSHGNEPSVKSFFYAKHDNAWSLSDFKAYHFSKENDESDIHFKPLYEYRKTYCPNNQTNLLMCLDNVTDDKIKKFFSAGNKHFEGVMNSPEDIILNLNPAGN